MGTMEGFISRREREITPHLLGKERWGEAGMMNDALCGEKPNGKNEVKVEGKGRRVLHPGQCIAPQHCNTGYFC